jgi:hypothetical protein
VAKVSHHVGVHRCAGAWSREADVPRGEIEPAALELTISRINGGERFVDARSSYADEVGVELLPVSGRPD